MIATGGAGWRKADAPNGRGGRKTDAPNGWGWRKANAPHGPRGALRRRRGRRGRRLCQTGAPARRHPNAWRGGHDPDSLRSPGKSVGAPESFCKRTVADRHFCCSCSKSAPVFFDPLEIVRIDVPRRKGRHKGLFLTCGTPWAGVRHHGADGGTGGSSRRPRSADPNAWRGPTETHNPDSPRAPQEKARRPRALGSRGYFLCFPPFFLALCLIFFGQPVTLSLVFWLITAPSWATSSVGIVSVPALQRLAPLAVRAE